MFDTLILQYLNKLVEGKVGDLTSPKPLHAIKVQGFNRNRIKTLTKFCRKLPMKVCALVCDFTIQTGYCPNTPPPSPRTFLFTTQFFVEATKFIQGLFQRLWVLFLLTRAKGQVRVFHAEVCSNALTCCRQTFHVRGVRGDTKPIVTAVITLYRDIPNRTVPLTVFMESVRYLSKRPKFFRSIPLSKSKCDPIVFHVPSRLSGKGDRLELMPFFDVWSTPKFLEKTIICFINTPQFFLNRLARQGVPILRQTQRLPTSRKLKHGVLAGRLITGAVDFGSPLFCHS